VANTLELELLRTQVDASKEKIAALKEANKWLRVTLLETSTLRQKVAEADVRIQTLEAELAAIEATVPKLDAILEEFMNQNDTLQSECEKLNERLQEMQEERESHEIADSTNDRRLRQQLVEAERQIRELNAQVQDLSQQLAAANAARSANLMPAPPVGSATPDMFTPQANARTPDYVKSDRFAPAAGNASPNMHPAPPNTAPARILSRAERRTLWTPLTIGVTTGRVTETMSPNQLAATNKELKAKLRNSKQLREQYAEKLTALQQTARSYQESAQEAEREVKKLQKKIHKLQGECGSVHCVQVWRARDFEFSQSMAPVFISILQKAWSTAAWSRSRKRTSCSSNKWSR
jgi:peptidoglycan hydrolase CwlO-like protein